MKFAQRMLLVWLVAHLGLSAISAGGGRLPLPRLADRIVATYAAITGASNGYSFFAPGVGTELRPTFELTDDKGTVSVTSLNGEIGGNREVALRLNKIIAMYWDEISDEKARRAISASLAGKVMARHPGARAIALRLDQYALPSMAEYREGKRPVWDLFYEAKFSRAARRGL